MTAVDITKAHKGAVAEAMAASWLLQQGYYVFPSMTVTGPVDLIAWRPDETPILVDVKGCERSSWSSKTETKLGSFIPHSQRKSSKSSGIRLLFVNIARELISWDIADFESVAKAEDKEATGLNVR